MDPNLLPAVFHQSRLAMLVLDRAGRILTLNQAAAQLAGYPPDDLVGKPFVDLLDPHSRDKGAAMLALAQAEGQALDWELDQARSSGGLVLVGYDATRLADATGHPSGMALIGHNLSAKMGLTAQMAQTNQQLEGALLQLEKAHTQLQAAQTQLVQSEKMRALGQMVAGVAHEINNPAAFVSNNLAHLERRLPAISALFAALAVLRPLANPEQLAAVQAAEQAAEVDYLWQDLPDLVHESQDGIERIRGIVLSLRNFSRLDEANTKLADLNEGLQSTLRLVRPLAAGRVEIVERYVPLPPLLCRPGELNQVFLNLLTNAMQSIAGEGQVWVTSAMTAAGITITIRDTGSGMTPDTLARLGEPFFTTKPVGAGTGLGLAVSLAIVAAHQGRVRFESELGRGTTAIVELPVSHEPD